MTIRRAVMVAQLLGLHTPNHYRFKRINSSSELDPKTMWSCVLSVDRVLSLLLGLPSSTPATEQVLHVPCKTVMEGAEFRNQCTIIAAQILDRNSTTREYEQFLFVTRTIDKQLISLTEEVSCTFWKPVSFAGLDVYSVEAFHEVQRAWDHMCYYTLVIQLHLPHILCPKHDAQSMYSRVACVNASRELLNRQITVRSFKSSTASCRLGDFMALIAGMTLILAHTVSHYQASETDVGNLLAHQRVGDRAIIESGLETLKSMSELNENILEARCAVLLRDLLAVEADAAQSQSGKPSEHAQEQRTVTIKVPYVGTIYIGRDGLIAVPAAHAAMKEDEPEDVRVGGLGVVNIGTGKGCDLGAGTYHGDTSACLSSQKLTQQAIPISGFDLDNSLYPDVSAPMDDWVLQGADTAFFDSLLRNGTDYSAGL